jgi:hypothetical protein
MEFFRRVPGTDESTHFTEEEFFVALSAYP